jgi:DNA-binding CsgD family transcriptional regulator
MARQTKGPERYERSGPNQGKNQQDDFITDDSNETTRAHHHAPDRTAQQSKRPADSRGRGQRSAGMSTTLTQSPLTARETQVLKRLWEGAAAYEIAEELFISKRTVDFHCQNIYKKFKVGGKVLAIRRAMELGILRSPFAAKGASL